ncbi:unnamed protein product, partial [Symbiodinium sp. CCMP2456]
MAEQQPIGLLQELARDFNVRDPRKLFQIARREFPDRRDLTSARAAAALRGDVARQILDALPGQAVHRQKDPSDRNATAVVDRAIQTLKKDLAGKVARSGGGWAEHVDEAAEAYNARPHQAVTVAPEDVE